MKSIIHPDDCLNEAQRLSRTWAIVRRSMVNYATLGDARFIELYYRCMAEIGQMQKRAEQGSYIVSVPRWDITNPRDHWDGKDITDMPSGLDSGNEGSVLVFRHSLGKLIKFDSVVERERYGQKISSAIYDCMDGVYWLTNGRGIDINAL